MVKFRTPNPALGTSEWGAGEEVAWRYEGNAFKLGVMWVARRFLRLPAWFVEGDTKKETLAPFGGPTPKIRHAHV